MKKIKLLPISDIHSSFNIVDHLKLKFNEKDIDFICIAGDVLERSSDHNFVFFQELLKWQSKAKIVFISGNHDYHQYKPRIKALNLQDRLIYLENESQIIDGIKFYGSPLSLPFYNWNFMKEDHEILAVLKMTMDHDIDIALFHSPPYGFGDIVSQRYISNKHLGSHAILNAINEFFPKYAFWGHIHTGDHSWNIINDITIGKNVSVLDEYYNIDLTNIEIVEIKEDN